MKDKTIRVVVKFNQQQLQLLDSLKKERRFGSSYADVVVNIFREYVRQDFGKRGV